MAALLVALETEALRNALKLDTAARVLLINTENDTDPHAYQSVIDTAHDP